jgi:hypothetical protein
VFNGFDEDERSVATDVEKRINVDYIIYLKIRPM